MATLTLDKTDRAIIQALKGDGRLPFSTIAAQLNVSPGMIRQRVQRLTESGVLQFAAVTNPLRPGYHTMALIGVKADGHRLREAETFIYLDIVKEIYAWDPPPGSA